MENEKQSSGEKIFSLKNMKIHDIQPLEIGVEVLRVHNGWIYYRKHRDHITSVFVPIELP